MNVRSVQGDLARTSWGVTQILISPNLFRFGAFPGIRPIPRPHHGNRCPAVRRYGSVGPFSVPSRCSTRFMSGWSIPALRSLPKSSAIKCSQVWPSIFTPLWLLRQRRADSSNPGIIERMPRALPQAPVRQWIGGPWSIGFWGTGSDSLCFHPQSYLRLGS